MSALSRVSVFKIPFSLSVVIPNAASFLRDLTNDQNFFTFSFFSRAIGIRVFRLKRKYIGNMLPVCVSYDLLNMCSEPCVLKFITFSYEAFDRTVDP